MTIHETVTRSLYGSGHPFRDFPRSLFQTDEQGWNSQHAYLTESIDEIRPSVVVEIGVWKGGSTIFMGKKIQALGLDCAVISIDTWLGSWDHWIHDKFREELNFINGYPTLYNKFMANVLANNLEQVVVPLPLDSINAFNVLRERNIAPQIIHIDGAHDYESVRADIAAWWGLLEIGGVMIGDDYFDDIWPGVKRAYDEFAAAEAMAVEHMGGKCRFRKGRQKTSYYYNQTLAASVKP